MAREYIGGRLYILWYGCTHTVYYTGMACRSHFQVQMFGL